MAQFYHFAAADPAVTDDLGAGFQKGTRWINTDTKQEFRSDDDTDNAAVWTAIERDTLPTVTVSNPASPYTLVGTHAAVRITNLDHDLTINAPSNGDAGNTRRIELSISASAADRTITPNTGFTIYGSGTTFVVASGTTKRFTLEDNGSTWLWSGLPSASDIYVAANSVVANNTASAGPASTVALTASQLFGRGSTGNLAPIDIGTNLSMSGATLNAVGSTEPASSSGQNPTTWSHPNGSPYNTFTPIMQWFVNVTTYTLAAGQEFYIPIIWKFSGSFSRLAIQCSTGVAASTTVVAIYNANADMSIGSRIVRATLDSSSSGSDNPVYSSSLGAISIAPETVVYCCIASDAAVNIAAQNYNFMYQPPMPIIRNHGFSIRGLYRDSISLGNMFPSTAPSGSALTMMGANTFLDNGPAIFGDFS